MSSNSVIPSPGSKPKVHRLPASLSSQKVRSSRAIPYLRKVTTVAIFAIFVFVGLFVATRAVITRDIPTVTVSAEHLAPSAGGGDALASIPRVGAYVNKSKGTTIHIEGRRGAITGQLARIPLENGEMSHIKTVSEVDNRAGRELLSIISKY